MRKVFFWKDVLFCGNHWGGSVMWPRFTVYTLVSCFPPNWNSLKLFHCWIPLAMTQDSCHAVGYVNCMYNEPCRNTFTVPILDLTSGVVIRISSVSTESPLLCIHMCFPYVTLSIINEIVLSKSLKTFSFPFAKNNDSCSFNVFITAHRALVF